MSLPRATGDAAISPTAYCTGYIWARNGLAPPAYATYTGRAMYLGIQPLMAASRHLGGPSLEGLILIRHRCIDHLLRQAIDAGEITQVIEVAAGFSPRGWRFKHDYGDRLTYIETDLPGMVAAKRRLLHKAGSHYPGHHLRVLDAKADTGPTSLAAMADSLDPAGGLAIITEGLINYFDEAAARTTWRRFTDTLARFYNGLYLSDLHLADDNSGPVLRVLTPILNAFVRGRVHLHFADATAACAALGDAGFNPATLHQPQQLFNHMCGPDARPVRIVEARTRG